MGHTDADIDPTLGYLEDDVEPDFGPEVEASLHQAGYRLVQALMPFATMYRRNTQRINDLEDELDRMHSRLDEVLGGETGPPAPAGEPGWWAPLNNALARNRNEIVRNTLGDALRQVGIEYGPAAMRFCRRYGFKRIMGEIGSEWTEEHADVLDDVLTQMRDRGTPPPPSEGDAPGVEPGGMILDEAAGMGAPEPVEEPDAHDS